MNCNCSYCTQFFFARNHKRIKNQQNSTNNTNNTNITNVTNKTTNNATNDTDSTNINFTLKDMDTIYQLNLIKLNSDDISDITKMPKTMVEYILELINWKK